MMETVVMIIMMAVSFSFILKLTFHRSLGAIALALVAAVFVFLACDRATTQSKTQIADWLQNPSLMLDASIWLTVDVAFQICFCIIAAKGTVGKMSKRDMIASRICLWIPGLLIFPVLFAALTQLIFALPGMDFAVIGLSTGAAVLLVVPLTALAVKWLLPEKDIRLELMLLINLFIAALGIVATVNGRTAAAGTNNIDMAALAAVFGLLAAGGVAGSLLNQLLTNRKVNRIQKQ